MTLEELLGLCKAYADLGSAVQEQLDEMLDLGTADELNVNAVEMIRDRFLRPAVRAAVDVHDALMIADERLEDF